MSSHEIFGCSAFGLADKVAQVEGPEYAEDFYLADAVLPAHPFGEIRTGETAESERIHSGLSWPPEARVHRGKTLRRAPIPCVWRGLVEAGDCTAQWQIGRGVGFTLSRILGRHVSALLTHSGCKSQDKIVLAIPDNLDEFGQDALLRDLTFFGYPNVELLWRPVAAALSWVSELDAQGAFSLDTHVREYLIVAYLGPDAIEVTSFALKRVVKEGTWIIPVRERSSELVPMTGFDWAANSLEAFKPNMDDGAFWQAFTNFPHVWEAMAGRRFTSGKKIWSLEDRWTIWEPDAQLTEKVRMSSCGPNERLRAILGQSCKLFTDKQTKVHQTVEEKVCNLFKKVANACSDSQLRGVIFAGPLCPSTLPQSIAKECANRDSMNKSFFSDCNKPQIDSIWLAHDTDAILDGCREYGRRIDLNLPTYLDTLPQLSMLVQRKGQHAWVPLLNAETCEGGQYYSPEPIRHKFAIQSNAKSLLVYLKKGDVRGQGVVPGDEMELSFLNRQKLDARIKKAGCYEKAVKKCSEISELEGRYVRNIAKKLYGNPFRRAEFPFPVVPTKDMPVDIFIKMRPASGLAKISLTPSAIDDIAFLRGRHISLDYSTMAETEPPPSPKGGWPEVVSIKVDPLADLSDVQTSAFEKFLQVEPNQSEYIDIVDLLGKNLQIKTNVLTKDGFTTFCFVDERGMAGTEAVNKMIDRIVEKAFRDYNRISSVYQRPFATRISWLYAKTPPNIRDGIYKAISSHYNGEWVLWIEAAGRAFTDKKDLQHLYRKIVDRIRSQHNNPFPIQSSRALWRTLTLMEDSPNAMKAEYSKVFAKEAVKIMKRESVQGNYSKSFFQASRLFLYLLRFRIVQPEFLDPGNVLDADLFEEAVTCLNSAAEYFSRKHNAAAERARKIVIGIKKFMHYEGSNDILAALDEQAGDH